MGEDLRVGLVGTGYWAATTHAPALASAPGVRFAGVWGRRPDAADALAKQWAVPAYETFDSLVAAVDAIDLAVPPDVQAPLAEQAARAGRHLLLEKPIALDVEAAEQLAATVQDTGVASLVFVTALFDPRVRELLARARAEGGWRGGAAVYLGSALGEENPFNTPWRRVHGGLWDLGPHAVSLLAAALGPVERVVADHGADDLVHLVLHHAGGATSTATLTLSAPDAADGFGCSIWGSAGRVAFPVDDLDPVATLRTALDELAGLVRSGERDHAASIRTGLDDVRVLAAAQAGGSRLAGPHGGGAA